MPEVRLHGGVASNNAGTTVIRYVHVREPTPDACRSTRDKRLPRVAEPMAIAAELA
jgi:hypothetical protein